MLSKDELLNRTNKGLDVFRHYIPGEWRVGRNFLNPLYEDRKASCNIYFDHKSNGYRMKDFGNDAYSGDCFAIVGYLKGLDCRNAREFVIILETINDEMGLSNASSPVSVYTSKIKNLTSTAVNLMKENKPSFSIIQKPFTRKELDFWQKYDITEEMLKAYKVISLREFKSQNKDGKEFCFTSSEAEPLFGYVGKHFIKIYRPCSDIRFLYDGNLGENYCFGLEKLPAKSDLLFITGGEKDRV